MFDRQVMTRMYRTAEKPSDVPWHSDDPDRFLQEVVAERGPPGRALDLGCGTGSYAVWLAKQGYAVTGIDVIPEALAFARRRSEAENVAVTWLEADLFAWDQPAPFDLVLDSGCLHSLIGGSLPAYKRKILQLVRLGGGDLVLGHWGKKHALDWLPIGPRRRSREKLVRMLGPELEVVRYLEVELKDIPRPFGPTVLGMGFWFQRKSEGP